MVYQLPEGRIIGLPVDLWIYQLGLDQGQPKRRRRACRSCQCWVRIQGHSLIVSSRMSGLVTATTAQAPRQPYIGLRETSTLQEVKLVPLEHSTSLYMATRSVHKPECSNN